MNLRIKIKTLTPIWTGDIDGKCSRVKETGIIGSLRWWYEALVRGCSEYACDPTSDERCALDKKKFNEALSSKSVLEALDEQICPTCQLFGCTGWSRRFKLNMLDEQQNVRNFKEKIKIELHNRKHLGNKTPTWYLDSGWEGETDLDIIFLKYYNPNEENILKLTIKIIEKWGAIGAKTQLGYGVFTIKEIKENNKDAELRKEDVDGAIDFLCLKQNKNNSKNTLLPNLKEFFFSKVEIKNGYINKEDRLKKLFELKYDLRRLFKDNENIRYFIMGTTKKIKIGAKIFISRVYQNKEDPKEEGDNKKWMRIWGWIPTNIADRENNIAKIKSEIEKRGEIKWREFNSDRDNKQKTDDFSKFIKENLLEM